MIAVAAVREPTNTSIVRNPKAVRMSRKGVRVMLVENDPLIRRLIVEMLRDEGSEVTEVATADKRSITAVGSARRCWSPIFRMPGPVDGWDLAERSLGDLRHRLFAGASPTSPRQYHAA